METKTTGSQYLFRVGASRLLLTNYSTQELTLDGDDIPRVSARWMTATYLHGDIQLGLPHL